MENVARTLLALCSPSITHHHSSRTFSPTPFKTYIPFFFLFLIFIKKFLTALTRLAAFAAASPGVAPKTKIEPELEAHQQQQPSAGFTLMANFRFSLQALGVNVPFNLKQIQASGNNIYVNLAQQNAQCQGQQQNFATFYVNNGELYLFTPDDTPDQIVYVDRSYQAGGIIGYLDVSSGCKPSFETRGWSLGGTNELIFNNQFLYACPSRQGGAFGIFVNIGTSTPGGCQGCVRVTPRVQRLANPVGCQYC